MSKANVRERMGEFRHESSYHWRKNGGPIIYRGLQQSEIMEHLSLVFYFKAKRMI